MKFVMAISQTCGKLGKSDRLLCYFGKKSALSENKGDRTLRLRMREGRAQCRENKGDSLRDSYARAYFEKGTIALHPKHYQTGLRYCVTGFKWMSSLSVSILNKWQGMPAAIKASKLRALSSPHKCRLA